ncbi:PIG-L deacetylase family protein [Nakamurella sp. GG22]
MTEHRETERTTDEPDTAAIGTLLGIWAHPDDEAYLSAGLMSVARDAGHRVVVATATRGEAGTDDPVTWPPERLSREREKEAVASLAAVGVHEHRWLGHRDGTLHLVPPPDGIRQVAALIDEVRPDTIVTFGPDGMTGHGDHRTISEWVTTAWMGAGRPGRLWYATFTPQFHLIWGALNTEVGLWFEGSDPPSDLPSELSFTVRCDGERLERKYAALAAHRTQTAGLINHVGPDRYRNWWAAEYFVDASRRIEQRRAA